MPTPKTYDNLGNFITDIHRNFEAEHVVVGDAYKGRLDKGEFATLR